MSRSILCVNRFTTSKYIVIMAHGISQEKLDEIGLEPEQVNVLKKCFDGFCQDGLIPVDTIGTILTMMDLRVKPSALREIIDEVDEDRSGFLEFEEFCQLSAKFLVEVDEEVLKKCFDSFCQDGLIPVDTIGNILTMMELGVNSSALRAIIDDINFSTGGFCYCCCSGFLNFEEFCQLSASLFLAVDKGMKKELKEAFRIYDKAGNGYIPISALKEILHELDPKLTDHELDGIIAEIDEDDSGTVDFDEFMEMMTG